MRELSTEQLEKEIKDHLGKKLNVPTELLNPEPLVAATKKRLLAVKVDQYRYMGTVEAIQGLLNTRVSVANIDRAMAFWDTFIKCIKARGHKILATYENKVNRQR